MLLTCRGGQWRRVRPADGLLFLAFAAAAVKAFRNEMLIGLLAPVLIASYFPWKRRLPLVASYAAAAALLAAVVWGSRARLVLPIPRRRMALSSGCGEVSARPPHHGTVIQHLRI